MRSSVKIKCTFSSWKPTESTDDHMDTWKWMKIRLETRRCLTGWWAVLQTNKDMKHLSCRQRVTTSTLWSVKDCNRIYMRSPSSTLKPLDAACDSGGWGRLGFVIVYCSWGHMHFISANWLYSMYLFLFFFSTRSQDVLFTLRLANWFLNTLCKSGTIYWDMGNEDGCSLLHNLRAFWLKWMSFLWLAWLASLCTCDKRPPTPKTTAARGPRLS